MNKSEVVIVLLVVMILLLIEPQEKRQARFGQMLLLGAFCAGISYLEPFVIGLMVAFKEAHGWSGIILYLLFPLMVIAYFIGLVVAHKSGQKRNRAIWAGSQVEFDNRVAELIALGFNSETAIAEVTKLRDERQDREHHGIRWFLDILNAGFVLAFHKKTLDGYIRDKNNNSANQS
jgi:hypothetical protein